MKLQIPSFIIINILSNLIQCKIRTDREFWQKLATNELNEALKLQWNTNKAKNVILFIGDGMGPNTVTATRIYKKGESGQLVYEKFPHMGLLKTYSANKMVPDSASTATALLTGVKVNQHTTGVDTTVQESDCYRSTLVETHLKTLTTYSIEAGKSTGFVTTMRVTHATPSAMYAHSSNRHWECESKQPESSLNVCKDIARQLIEDDPGRNINVIMGGGRQMLLSNSSSTASDPIDTWACYSLDGRNLFDVYKQDKINRGLKYTIAMNNSDLGSVNVNEVDYLLGVFANGHLQMEHERDDGPSGMPSIVDMTRVALDILKKNNNGYFLMVEGGNIDFAHHRGKARRAVNEAAMMEEAVQLVVNMTDPFDTLIIVCSDHTHTLTINGYPDRGNNIFGIAEMSKYDGVNYTTLSYGTGGPGSFHYSIHNDSVIQRDEPINTEDFDYEQVASIITDENTHGGGDVAVYALGPYSHLLHNVHEQNYVFYVICYAAQLGNYANNSSNILMPFYFTILIFYVISFIIRIDYT